jgi:hypothetical protein
MPTADINAPAISSRRGCENLPSVPAPAFPAIDRYAHAVSTVSIRAACLAPIVSTRSFCARGRWPHRGRQRSLLLNLLRGRTLAGGRRDWEQA